MNLKIYKTGLLLSMTVSSPLYASLASDAVLNFESGQIECVLEVDNFAPTGCLYDNTNIVKSYFAIDYSGDNLIQDNEKYALMNAGNGLRLGVSQAMGAIDSGALVQSGLWRHSSTSAPGVISTTANTAVIDLSGWSVEWAGSDIGMGSGVEAVVSCFTDCSVDDSFTLDYSATIGPGSLNGLLYELHLEGIVASPVPVPAAAWLFGSGLLGLFGIARRKRNFK